MPEIESLSTGAHLWVLAVLVGSGFFHGLIGLGLPLIAMPLLALVLPFKAAVLFLMLPMLCVNVVTSLWGGRLRQSVLRFWYMLIAPVAGAWIGTRLLIGAPPEPFILVLAVMLVAYLARERLGGAHVPLVLRHEVAFGVGAGLLGGFFESITNVSLPPLVIYFMMLGLAPGPLVQMLNFQSVGTKASQIATWSISGGVPGSFWLAALPWAAATVAAVLAGTRIRTRVHPERYMIWLRRFLWAMAALLVVQFLHATLSS